MSFVFVDLETTGLRASSAEILTADFIVLNNDYEEQYTKSFKFKPRIWDKEASDAAKIHGITREIADTFPPYHESAKEMFDWLSTFSNSYLCFHANRQFNTSYDAAILRFHALDNGAYFEIRRAFPECNYISTHSMASYLKVDSSLDVKSLSKYFRVGSFKHHSSEEDVRMCLKIFNKMIRKINLIDFLEWERWKKEDAKYERISEKSKKSIRKNNRTNTT